MFNFRHYSAGGQHVSTWKGAFKPQELDILQNNARKASGSGLVGTSNNHQEAVDVRRSNIAWLDFTEFNWVYERIAFAVQSINSTNFHYDLTGFGEQFQLSNYSHEKQGTYSWHTDGGLGEGPVRKLSVVLQLSDPSEYTGGEFQVLLESNPITLPKERGTIYVFPSWLLHQVTPVLTGSRQSLVSWVNGPAFR